MKPPEIDPVAYFEAKVRWRYRHGVPDGAKARILLEDARTALPRVRRRFNMLLTSPPYCGVTNYRVDNWIRLWMLGEAPLPSWEVSQRYGHREQYAALLGDVLGQAARALLPDAVVYVRTDARAFTLNATAGAMQTLWPSRILLAKHGRARRSQTSHYGDGSLKPGEVDLLLGPTGLSKPMGFRTFDEIANELRDEHSIDAAAYAEAA